ncbi:MAG: hypothetical protein ACRELD_03485 [Longimicrobiales bacterium]
MWQINRLIGAALDAVLAPFRGLPPAVGLAFVSIVAAAAMLLVFRVTSDQSRLKATKRRMHAAILEIRLFNEQPRLVLSAQADVLRQSLRYFQLTLVPLLWLALPVLLLMTHLHAHYGNRGLAVGESAIVRLRLADARALDQALTLEADGGARVETPLLAIPATSEADWRIAALLPGDHRLRLRIGDKLIAKTLRVSTSPARLSPRRPGRGLLDQILFPSEPPVPRGSAAAGIEVGYSPAEVSLLGWRVHWVIAFLIFTLAAALALRRPLRVTF